MAVLTNTMMQGASAFEEAADGYQIEKSLRFNDPDSSYIKKTNYYSGDRRTWTASFWMKNCYNAPGHIFGAWIDTNNRDNTYFIPTSGKCQFTLNWKTGGSWHVDKSSNEQLRDPSAWTHCVVHWNTPHATATERAKVWANGRELTWGGGYNVTNPSQHALSIWNAACNHWIGAGPENDGTLQGTYMDGYIADFQFIDGLALYPGAFGTFDSTGNWNPKAFALPAPNTGTTLSSNTTGTAMANAGNCFDGSLSTVGYVNGGGNVLSEGGFTFSPGIVVSGALELYSGDSYKSQYRVNDGPWSAITPTANAWFTHDFIGTMTKLTMRGTTAENALGRLTAARVDGVVLVDGQTDPTDRTTVWPGKNNGTKWSDFFTAGGSSFGSSTTGGPATQAFDGLITTGSSHSANSIDNTLTFAPPERFTGVTKLEIYTDHHTTQTELRFNSGTNTSPSWSSWITGSTQTGWNDFTSHLSGGNFAAVETRQTVSNGAAFRAIRINDVILIDSSADNSFHLKFNNTGITKNIGKDSLSGKIADATGALPIYNTTDDYGDVKGSGYRADSSAGTTNDTGLVLAIPGDVLTDVHHNINTGSSQKTVTNDTGDAAGSITVKTDESILYGSSMYFNGTGNANLTLPDDADFGFGTGDFCVECWVRHETGGNLEIYYTDVGGDSAGIFLAKDSDDKVYVYYSSTILKGCTVLKTHQWYHVAYVRNSGVSKLYVNGVVDASVADTANLTTTEYSIGNAYSSDIGPFKGWMNDFRVYKGTSKYTANFIPPIHRGFDTINNLAISTDKVYSTDTSGGAVHASYPMKQSFDGRVNTAGVRAVSGGGFVFQPSGGYAYTSSIEVHSGASGVGTQQCEINDGTAVDVAENVWVTVKTGSGTLTKLEMTAGSTGNANIYLGAVRVDGLILTDAELGDVFADSPTSYGTDTGAGGQVRGNYCTLNPLQSDFTSLVNGNLDYTQTSNAWKEALGTIGVTSGKWYYEVQCLEASGSNGNSSVGFAWKNNPGQTGPGSVDYAVMFETSGYDQNFSTSKTNRNITVNEGDILGVSLDLDSGTPIMRTWVNDGDQNTINLGGTWSAGKALFPYVNSHQNTGRWRHFNFGQRPWQKTCPSGYKALCTQNLDDVFTDEDDINNPSKFFDVLSYEGVGGSLTHAGLGFGPDMIWSKGKTGSISHIIYDQVRTAGENKGINPDLSRAMGSCYDTASGTAYGYVSAFTSDGYTVADGNQSSGYVNEDGSGYMAACWDAGTAASGANTDGTINIASGDQWVNNNCGFSITKYTGTGADATFGHGLSTQPQFIIIKKYEADSNWTLQHVAGTLGSGRMILDENYANDTTNADTYWNSTAPTNDVISIGDHANTNGSSANHICYAWAEIPGYSSFGSYAGNNSTNGPFVFCGFKPRLVIIKCISQVDPWWMSNSASSPTNEMRKAFKPDTNDNEFDNNAFRIDYLSNGFKVRNADADFNGSGQTYLYCAWAESPFKTSRGH